MVHDRKLRKIGMDNDISLCDPNNVVSNYNSIDLPSRTKTLLAYGLDFCLPVHNINFYKYFLPIGRLVSSMKYLSFHNIVNFTEFLNELHSISFKYFHNFCPFKVFFSSVFSKRDISELKRLATNKDIIVCKPDIGRGVVVLDKETYITEMINIISDEIKFEKLSFPLIEYILKK